MSDFELNESETRALLVDPYLEKAGWKLGDRTQVLREIPVDGYDAEPWNGVTDYCLYQVLHGIVWAAPEDGRVGMRSSLPQKKRILAR